MNMKKKQIIKITATIIVLAAVILGGFFFWQGQKQKNKKFDRPSYENRFQKMTLEQAAREGEFSEMKLVVQIKNLIGNSDDAKSRLERGDVIVVKPANWNFSATEKKIFLIIKVKLTPTLADLIVQPLINEKGKPPLGGFFASKNTKAGPPVQERIKRRKFAVDLSSIGIKDGDEQGREITDKTFDWTILKQKSFGSSTSE